MTCQGRGAGRIRRGKRSGSSGDVLGPILFEVRIIAAESALRYLGPATGRKAPALGRREGRALRPTPLDSSHHDHQPVRQPGWKLDPIQGLEFARHEPRSDCVHLS